MTAADIWPRWMWAAICILAAIDCAWLLLTPISLTAGSMVTIAGVFGGAMAGTMISRRFAPHDTPRTLLVGGSMLLAAWPALRLFNHLSMTTAFPLADPFLAGMDTAIGFDWLGYLKWLDGHPDLVRVMGVAYSSLTNYSIALYLALVLGPEPAERCAEFVKLFLLTALVCMAAGMFFPATAAIIYYAPAPGTFSFITGHPGAYHLEALTALRTDPRVVLDMQDLPGLVTFPSFHTAMGVIGIWCARHSRPLLVVSTLINLTMIASTPLFGAHYGIDVLAGAGVALAAIVGLQFAEPRARRATPQERAIKPAMHWFGRRLPALPRLLP